jgi:hypothetical protein
MAGADTDVGLVTRYFLRRYAQARRKSYNANAFVPYSNAAFEVSLVFVALPAIAVFSTVLISSVKWAPPQPGAAPLVASRYFAVILLLVFVGIGHWHFFRKFRRYRTDPSECADFDGEADQRIIYWQKFAALVLFGVVIPWIAIAITEYWLR